MRAAQLSRHGAAPDHGSAPDPTAAAGSTLVAITAAPIVPLDLLCASGTSYFGPPELPYVPGVQGVGTVVASDAFPVGARVFVSTSAGMAAGNGSLADLCLVPDTSVIVLDTAVDDAAVAAIGLSGVAAWMALSWRGQFRVGETVLILGAGGAVGQAGIGAAIAQGASRVVAVCRSAAAAERAARAEPHDIVMTSDDPDVLLGRLRAACPTGVDVVLDPVFGSLAAAATQVLADGGRLVNLGSAGGATADVSSAVLRSKSAAILGYTNNALSPGQRAGALTAVLNHAETGRITVDHEVRPLSQCALSWQRTANGGARQVLLP